MVDPVFYNERFMALSVSSIRSLIRRRDFPALKKSVSFDPSVLSRLWTKLTPLERAACWRMLPSSALKAAVSGLTTEQAWFAYLSQPVECLAPLLEGASASARRAFRAPSAREAALLRARLA